MSLALVLNELLTNAVKYGTAPGHLCRINVRLVQEDGAARLTITNPVAANRLAEVDSSGTGTRLMEAFLRQLGGRLESERTDEGFVAEVVIPLK